MLRNVQQGFWDARKYPLTYFGVAYSLGLSANLISALLWTNQIARWVIGLVPPVFVVAVILSKFFPRFLPQREVEVSSDFLRPARHYKGVVTIISLGPGVASAEAAARYHAATNPGLFLWMITSPGSHHPALLMEAKLLQEHVVSHGRTRLIALSDDDFNNPEKVREAIEAKVYDDLPPDLSESDVVIDLTGGRKLTTAGAFLAALPQGRRIEVNEPAVIDPAGHAVSAGDPIEIVLDYHLRKLSRRKA
jgi:hypothetical protein